MSRLILISSVAGASPEVDMLDRLCEVGAAQQRRARR